MPADLTDRPATAQDRHGALRAFAAVLDALRRQFQGAGDAEALAMLRGACAELDALAGVWPDLDDAALAGAARDLAGSPLAADLLHRVLGHAARDAACEPAAGGGAGAMPFVRPGG